MEAVLDLLERALEVGADAVELIDEAHPRNFVLVGLAPDGFALGFNAFDRAEHDDGAIQDAEAALDLGREIDVAGRVDQVDRVVLPLAADGGGVNGDSAGGFFGVEVGGGVAVVDVAHFVGGAGVVEDALRGRRLSRVNVGDDADVAELVDGSRHWKDFKPGASCEKAQGAVTPGL